METEMQETKKNALVLSLGPLAQLTGLPSLPVSCRNSANIGLVAPAFQAERLEEAEAGRRKKEELALKEQKRRIKEERLARRATFSSD